MDGRKFLWARLAGLLLVPLLIAGGLLWSNWNSDSRLHEVRAAIVNLDEPVTLQGQYTPLGRQLTAALMDSSRVQNLTWVLETADGAASGLESGDYAASVTIPSEFSAAATSFSGNASDAIRATIAVQTSPVAGVADATLAKVVAREAVDTLNGTLTSAYLDQIYIGFNEMGKQFMTVADAARQLDDGVAKYVDGVAQSSAGAYRLSVGANQVANGLDTMKKKTQPLPGGLRQLADGLGTMKKKTKDLPSQTRQLATGLGTMKKQTKDLPAQTKQLADGMATMKSQTTNLPTQTRQLADGAGQLAAGTKTYVDTVNSAVTPLIDLLHDNPGLSAQINALLADSSQLPAQVKAVQAAIDEIDRLAALDPATLPGALPPGMSCDTLLGSATLPAGVDKATVCSWYYRGLSAGIDQADRQLDRARADGTLDAAMQQLTDAADLLASLPADTSVLSLLDQFRDGGDQLISGTSQLATGTQQLADGMPALVKGIGQAADGTQQLADQMPALVGGIGQLADGATQVSGGVDTLHQGLSTLATKGLTLSDGSKQLADGLAKGKSQIPHYSTSDRQALSAAVTTPVDTGNLVGSWQLAAGWASLLLVLSLWLGALAASLVIRTSRRRLLASALPTVRLVVETVAPVVVVVAVQALVVTVAGQFALGLPPGKLAAVTALMLLAGVAFALIHYALVAWLRGAGWVISVALAVLGAATMLTGALPGVFGVARGFSPLSPALDAIRAVITESSGAPANTVALAGWLVVGALASAIAIMRSRTTTFAAILQTA